MHETTDLVERWLPIPGYDWYEVSDQGRVRSLPMRFVDSRGRRVTRQGRLLKPQVGRAGYLHVKLCRPGDSPTTVQIHRLVPLVFVGPLPEGQETRHRDGNQVNNALSNLTYGTHSENQMDSVRHGTHGNVAKTHCAHGHEFTEANTYRPPDKPWTRRCRACNAARARRSA